MGINEEINGDILRVGGQSIENYLPHRKKSSVPASSPTQPQQIEISIKQPQSQPKQLREPKTITEQKLKVIYARNKETKLKRKLQFLSNQNSLGATFSNAFSPAKVTLARKGYSSREIVAMRARYRENENVRIKRQKYAKRALNSLWSGGV